MERTNVHIVFQDSELIVGVYKDFKDAEKELNRCLEEYDQEYHIESFILE